MKIAITINGRKAVREVAPHRTLLRFLRDDLGLTGTKEGCGAGECGACTVLLNGQPVNACLVLAAELDGATVETVEGLARNNRLARVQRSFQRHHAVQCGFCTPGMLMSITALLRANARPGVEEIKEAIDGNLCRCTGYAQIIDAVLAATGQRPVGKEMRHA